MAARSRADREDAEWLAAKDARVSELDAENARLRKLLGLVEGYHASAEAPPKWQSRKGGEAHRATACMLLSDLHLDEVVDPSQLNGLNAYDRPIAELRLRRWADKACEIGGRFGHRWDGALVLVDGDLVSGAIHEELVATNADCLPGSMVHWAPRLASALGQVVDHYGRAHVAVVVGNHGRLTIKKQAKGRGRNSWDWLLMKMVASHFDGDDRVTWQFSDGSYLFVPIYDRQIFETHGDEVGGGSGWAGVWSPLGTISRRGIELGVRHGIRVSYAAVGHWHSLTLAHHRGFVLNGSGKGYCEFAASLRLTPEPAMQAWWAETPERGVTVAAPLFLEDRKREGW